MPKIRCNPNTPALMIIDMQPVFDESYNDKIVQACVREVLRTKKEDGLIVVVEFNSCGKTELPIRSAIGKYQKCIYVTKCTDDGSRSVISQIRRKVFGIPKTFRVCGVNTDCCVAATVAGLHKFRSIKKFEMVVDACGSNQDTLRNAWRDFCYEVAYNRQTISAIKIPRSFPKPVKAILNCKLNFKSGKMSF